MNLVLAHDEHQQAWDDYVLWHPEGLAYQLYAWRLAVEHAYGFKCYYFLAEERGRVCGVLPLVDFRSFWARRRLISLPFCDVGGVLADDKEVEKALLNTAEKWRKENGISGLEIRRSIASEAAVDIMAQAKVRMVLDLPASSENLMAGFKSKLRSQVKKAIRDGLTFRLGGAELADTFYDIFASNMRDLGSPVHSRRWIQAVVKNYGERARVSLVHTPKGQPAAAGIILCGAETVSIPWASSLRRYNSLNPNMLLYWSLLTYAADNGFRKFDFGRSTPMQGTYRFKEQWGAKPQPLCWIDSSRPQGGLFPSAGGASVRNGLENIWKKCPLGFCNLLGPKIRRCISL